MTPDYQFISNDNVKLDVTPEERWRDRDHLIYQFSKVSPEEREQRAAEAAKVAAAKAAAMEAKKAAAEKAAAAKASAEQAALDEAAREASVVEVTQSAASMPITPPAPIGSSPQSTPLTDAISGPAPDIISVQDTTPPDDTVEKLNIPMETITSPEVSEEKPVATETTVEPEKSTDTEDSSTGETENG